MDTPDADASCSMLIPVMARAPRICVPVIMAEV
jgi:hypothetical protein